eukprot:4289639-Prymnesium_polylepis.1
MVAPGGGVGRYAPLRCLWLRARTYYSDVAPIDPLSLTIPPGTQGRHDAPSTQKRKKKNTLAYGL